MNQHPFRLGFLASGGGSSARAIVEAIAAGLPAEARVLVSNRRDAPALVWAAEAGLATQVIPTLPDPDAADTALADALTAHGVNLVILSGYLRKLGPVTLERFAGHILNVHPGPLPEFGGAGMYGSRVHHAVLAAGLTASAIVIHVVDGDYDQGPEVARMVVPVRPGDTAADLEARVRAAEPAFFVETVSAVVAGKLPAVI